MQNLSNWMAWEAGVDMVGVTHAGLAMPNVIVHVARMVHTPVGSAPSGMILWQPDPKANPVGVGFVSTDPKVGAYFGPNIFAGTPFEQAPVLAAKIDIRTDLPRGVSARVEVAGLVIETQLSALAPQGMIHRPPAPMSPFWQQGLEAGAASATLSVGGKPVAVMVPPVGMGGGPGASWSACGVYAR